MRNLLFSVLILVLGSAVMADKILYHCDGNDLQIVRKVISGDYGYSRDAGLFMFIYGDLAKELQSAGLYPAKLVPGTSGWGLYWSEAAQLSQGEFGSNVRLANVTGPFFNYYMKQLNSGNATLEIWQTSGFRSVSEGVGNAGRLMYTKKFANCQ